MPSRRDCRSSRSPTSASRACVSAVIDCERSSASALIRASSASRSARACSVCAAVAVMPSRRDCTSPSSSLCRWDASSAAAAAEAAAAIAPWRSPESVSSVEVRRDCRSSRSPTNASRVCVSAAIDCELSSASALIRASSASRSARACSVCAAVAMLASRRDCTSPSSSLCRCDASSAAAAAEAAAAIAPWRSPESVSSVELRRDCRSSRSPTSASRACVSAVIDCERSSASALIRASSASRSAARVCNAARSVSSALIDSPCRVLSAWDSARSPRVCSKVP